MRDPSTAFDSSIVLFVLVQRGTAALAKHEAYRAVLVTTKNSASGGAVFPLLAVSDHVYQTCER